MATIAPVGTEGSAGYAPHVAHAHDAPHSFVRKYIFSTDHKIIGIQFLVMSLFFLLMGGTLAMMIRWQLGFPGRPMPGGGALPESAASGGILLPEFYNALVTMHGTFMVFFAIMPLLVGVFGNYLIPLKIGAPDMAFPKLNMASFWMAVPAGLVMLAGFGVEGGSAAAGWTAYAPLSLSPEHSGVTLGQQLWCVSIIILGLSSILGAVNYITTIVQLRAPGMTWMRLPLSIWSLFVTACLVLLAIPVLSGAAIMLLFDQTIGTHFFRPGLGGEPLLWQHLFWFFGHPEVYILILPAMGMVSDIIANGSRKPIFGYTSMVLAIIAIAFLGWVVWGHHMFQSGMNPMLGTSFMVATLLISVPSAVKTFNWLGTLWGGNIQFHVPMLHSLAFVSMFVIGGLSGVFMAAAPVDIYIHDTYFIVAHLHYVLFGGSLFAIFAAVTFWYPKMFGRLMNHRLGQVHFWLTFIAYNLVFFPMHRLGLSGHMRRIYDPNQYDFLKPLQGLNTFISEAAFVLYAAQLIFAINFIVSWWRGAKAGPNPWNDNGLEWTVPSPPPHGNFATVPHVHRGPYEFSSPLVEADFFPQSAPPVNTPPLRPTAEPVPPVPPEEVAMSHAMLDATAPATMDEVMQPPVEREFGTGVYNEKVGMWVFLASEVMFFTALIGSYVILRAAHPDAWKPPGEVLNVPITAVNTFLLICSSVTMVKAFAAVQDGDQAALRRWLVATVLIGASFVGVQIFEYAQLVGHGFVPSEGLYGSTFYTMTGFHGFHVTVGVICLAFVTWKAFRGKYTAHDHRGVEVVGLYWHFVDLVWIILFTIVYLI